jgi:K+-transporting ATPase ATPase B chain
MATAATRPTGAIDRAMILEALRESFVKLNPRTLIRNPVIFITAAVSLLATVIFVRDLVTHGHSLLFAGQVIVWLWFTVLFANFAEALAEGRGKAQADFLRRQKTQTVARRLKPGTQDQYEPVAAAKLSQGDVVLVDAGDFIPGDGEVIEGIATVDESASRAVIGLRSPAARESFPTASRSASRALRDPASWIE